MLVDATSALAGVAACKLRCIANPECAQPDSTRLTKTAARTALLGVAGKVRWLTS